MPNSAATPGELSVKESRSVESLNDGYSATTTRTYTAIPTE